MAGEELIGPTLANTWYDTSANPGMLGVNTSTSGGTDWGKVGQAALSAGAGAVKGAGQSGNESHMANSIAGSAMSWGRGSSLTALVQLLQQRYGALYPGAGGGGKGLLGV